MGACLSKESTAATSSNNNEPSSNHQAPPPKEDCKEESSENDHGGTTISEEETRWIRLQPELDKRLRKWDENKTDRINARTQHWPHVDKKGELEPALRSGAIQLLNARWLVNYVYNNTEEQQKKKKSIKDYKFDSESDEEEEFDSESDEHLVLPYRQKLPKEAFLSCDEIIEATTGSEKMGRTEAHIIVLSYMWLHPDHPDPKGTTLRVVARWCQTLFESKESANHCPRWALFWDYASLFQHPNPAKGLYRTLEETMLFQQGLNAMSFLYASPLTTVFRLKHFPNDGYPAGYNLPPHGGTTNCVSYLDRGWPLVETSLASLSKTPDKIVDIAPQDKGMYAGRGGKDENVFDYLHRVAGTGRTEASLTALQMEPLSLERMQERLSEASFTNAKEDRPLVLRLYKEKFLDEFANCHWLDFRGMNWSEEQVMHVLEIIQGGYVPKLELINLSGNSLGTRACKMLGEILMSKKIGGVVGDDNTEEEDVERARPCDDVILNNNPMPDVACIRLLAPGLIMGAKQVRICKTQMGARACQELAQAFQEQQLRTDKKSISITRLDINSNPDIGDEGVTALAPMITTHLKVVDLAGCNVGDSGCQALAMAARNMHVEEEQQGEQTMSCLTHLDLSRNKVTEESVGYLCQLLEQCPKMTRLTLPSKFLFHADEYRDQLKASCPNGNLSIAIEQEAFLQRLRSLTIAAKAKKVLNN